MSRDRGYDRLLTIFSPNGRLYQIEYATKAVERADLTALAVRGNDSIVLVCQKKLEDPRMDNKMLDHSSVTRLFSITPKIGAVVVGSIADGKSVISKARQEASEFKYNHGYDMPVYLLSKRMADLAQLNTQHAGRRIMGVEITFASVDDEAGPQVFKVDPSGHFVGYHAVSSGKLSQQCNTILEKRVQEMAENKAGSDLRSCVQSAIMTLQEAARVDFNSKNLEVGIIKDGGKDSVFERLSSDEVEQHLNEIAERD